MCSCEAHRKLVDCTCSCDHFRDRMSQWRELALKYEDEIASLKLDVLEKQHIASHNFWLALDLHHKVGRVKALRDDWARGRAPTAAIELSAALEGDSDED